MTPKLEAMIIMMSAPIPNPIMAPRGPEDLIQSPGKMNAPQPTEEPSAMANTQDGFSVLFSFLRAFSDP